MKYFIVGLLVLLIGAGASVTWYLKNERARLDQPLSIPEGHVRLVVAPGATLSEVTEQLHGMGVLDKPRSLVWYARWYKLANKIKAGEYAVPSGYTPLELLNQLIAGKVIQWSFTIIDGWNFKHLREQLAKDANLVHTLQDADDNAVMKILGHADVKPEGWFYPDTYHFPSGTTDIMLLERAMATMREKLDASWAQRDANLPYLQPYDALIMASIIEKETGAAAERARIAGVFVRRLRKGMRLETDPTVIYGLGETFDGNLTHKHLREDTPYNTYIRRGLPPTPISLPSGAAIDATLHPMGGTDLFFVARGDGSGTHYFSATYAEHKKAVRKYKLNRKGVLTKQQDGG